MNKLTLINSIRVPQMVCSELERLRFPPTHITHHGCDAGIFWFADVANFVMQIATPPCVAYLKVTPSQYDDAINNSEVPLPTHFLAT